MSVHWYGMPVCVRIVDKKDSADTDAFSGVHLVMIEEGKPRREMVVTLSYMQNVMTGKRILVNCTDANSNDSVNWYLARCISEESAVRNGSETDSFLVHLRSAGFSLLPNDNFNANVQGVRVLLMEIMHGSLWDVAGLKGHQPLEFGTAKADDEITISSCPFNLTNSLLFSHFTSNASINLAVSHTDSPQLYLSDNKYLENMMGALANIRKQHISIGLVLGNLRKKNNDGDLTAILPWSVVWQSIHKHFSLSKPPSIAAAEPSYGMNNMCVLPVMVNYQHNSSWGSCVYFKKDVLVTNLHVIRDFVESSEAKCTIGMQKGDSFELTSDDSITAPIKGLDIAFIKLSSSNVSRLSEGGYRPVSFAQGHNEGEDVRSVGFGLFFNRSYIEPLISRGIISRTFSLPIFTHKTAFTPSLIIASSACWNGSSGGGLFNIHGEFIGLICSNAQVLSPFAEEREANKTEKVPEFAFCLPTELISGLYGSLMPNYNTKLSYKMEHLWGLESNHLDNVIQGPRL